MIRLLLLIMAIIIGLVSAHSLGIVGKMQKDDGQNFEEMFAMMGKSTLEEKKSSLYKYSLLVWVIYVPYFFLAFNFFPSQTLPYWLTIVLVVIVVADYISGMRRIRRAKAVSDAVKITWLGKVGLFINLVIMAIHVGYII